MHIHHSRCGGVVQRVRANQSLHPSQYQMCVCVSPNKSVEVLLFVLDGSTSDAPAVVYEDAQEVEGRQHAGSSYPQVIVTPTGHAQSPFYSHPAIPHTHPAPTTHPASHPHTHPAPTTHPASHPHTHPATPTLIHPLPTPSQPPTTPTPPTPAEREAAPCDTEVEGFRMMCASSRATLLQCTEKSG